MAEQVILVDQNDVALGQMEKLEAHQKGLLHRAFSIFIFNSKGELLLQQRAKSKYHSGGLWTNTCCSHPRLEEKTVDAAHRRLKEEMGMQCELHYSFNFTYKVIFDDGLTEHELDHVYFGFSDHLPVINPQEVEDYRYVDMDELKAEIESDPEQFTTWLKICLEYFDNYKIGLK